MLHTAESDLCPTTESHPTGIDGASIQGTLVPRTFAYCSVERFRLWMMMCFNKINRTFIFIHDKVDIIAVDENVTIKIKE